MDIASLTADIAEVRAAISRCLISQEYGHGLGGRRQRSADLKSLHEYLKDRENKLADMQANAEGSTSLGRFVC